MNLIYKIKEKCNTLFLTLLKCCYFLIAAASAGDCWAKIMKGYVEQLIEFWI